MGALGQARASMGDGHVALHVRPFTCRSYNDYTPSVDSLSSEDPRDGLVQGNCLR